MSISKQDANFLGLEKHRYKFAKTSYAKRKQTSCIYGLILLYIYICLYIHRKRLSITYYSTKTFNTLFSKLAALVYGRILCKLTWNLRAEICNSFCTYQDIWETEGSTVIVWLYLSFSVGAVC